MFVVGLTHHKSWAYYTVKQHCHIVTSQFSSYGPKYDKFWFHCQIIVMSKQFLQTNVYSQAIYFHSVVFVNRLYTKICSRKIFSGYNLCEGINMCVEIRWFTESKLRLKNQELPGENHCAHWERKKKNSTDTGSCMNLGYIFGLFAKKGNIKYKEVGSIKGLYIKLIRYCIVIPYGVTVYTFRGIFYVHLIDKNLVLDTLPFELPAVFATPTAAGY